MNASNEGPEAALLERAIDPPIRADRVNRVRAAIAAGTYESRTRLRVGASCAAEEILRDAAEIDEALTCFVVRCSADDEAFLGSHDDGWLGWFARGSADVMTFPTREAADVAAQAARDRWALGDFAGAPHPIVEVY